MLLLMSMCTAAVGISTPTRPLSLFGTGMYHVNIYIVAHKTNITLITHTNKRLHKEHASGAEGEGAAGERSAANVRCRDSHLFYFFLAGTPVVVFFPERCWWLPS